MEAATESGTAPEEITEKVVEESPAEDRDDKTTRTVWNKHIHAGPGAQECEHGEDGRCKDPDHFHAFCRLPNSLQIGSIRDKANAVKARRLRALRDPETDRHVVMETDLETLKLASNPQELAAEIIGTTRWRDRGQAMVNVTEAHEEEFTHIDDDQERYRVLVATPESDRDADEFLSLTKHIDRWNELVEAELAEIQGPERQTLESKSMDELIDMIREERMKAEVTEVWMAAYSNWLWYIGTLKPRDPAKGLPVERVWKSIEEMKAAPPEHIEAVQTVYEVLENQVLSPTASDSVRAEGN